MLILNINLGVLGHIDSGKTSLAKVLSSVASTACFDKNPQSKERGITIDLGFSSFVVDIPEHFLEDEQLKKMYLKMQFTLVDCPGHASLIKTIIGGAQIMDMMLLVIDITKGIQTQTAECLIIGEITCDRMIVVLNKIDLLPSDKRETTIVKVSKRIQLTLKNSKFRDCKIVAVSTSPDNHELSTASIALLVEAIVQSAFVPKRNTSGSFLFAVDHCFPIRGQGTVMTGTVLQGRIGVNDSIEIPSLKIIRKIKSMQMFRESIEYASQGDRVGLCVTQFDPKLLERGIACTPGSVPLAYSIIVNLEKLLHFKQAIKNKAKYHITSGHETVMATISLFRSPSVDFNFDTDYEYCDEVSDTARDQHFFAVLALEHPIPAIPGGLIIGSKFDTDIHSNVCRIAFRGNILFIFDNENYVVNDLARLKVYKIKRKEGVVERVSSPSEVIAKNLFKKETNIQKFLNLKVSLSTGENGVIESSFGQSGKVKIRMRDGLQESTKSLFSAAKRKGQATELSINSDKNGQVKVILEFKRYIYDAQKRMAQT